MGLIKVQPFNAGPGKSGVSMSQGESHGRIFFRLGLTAAAQKDLFERVLDPGKDAIALTVTNARQQNHLMGIKIVPASDPGGLAVSGGPRGSVGLKLTPWRAGAGGKRPAVSLTIVNRQVQGGGISVKLPDWARPEPDIAEAARG